MYQLAHYVGLGDSEYVVIIDTDNDEEAKPEEFVRRGYKLQELVDLDVDLSSFPAGYELRKV